MPKSPITLFFCSSCGFESPKWVGQCPGCEEWNTLVEAPTRKPSSRYHTAPGFAGRKNKVIVPKKISEINEASIIRTQTGIEELDRVLGGGFVPGQVVLLAGEPGVGKSTLLLQVANSSVIPAKAGIHSFSSGGVIYISGEESVEQVALRAKRLGIKNENILLVNETDADTICEFISDRTSFKDALIIVDSVQTLSTQDLTGTAGSVGQVKECSFRLTQLAKNLNIPMVLVGHITKEGDIAGPKILEHIVDTVLYMEGDKDHLFRLLKSSKNRYGSVDEVGVFEMADSGLKEVKNPSSYFLSERLNNISGSVVSISMEGSRPFAVEIQALATKTSFGYPKRTSFGISLNRVQILCAVLEKRLKLPLSNYDIYINVSGGLTIDDTSSDLAVCLAIYSSIKDIAIPNTVCAFGEVGLGGEVKKITHLEKRLSEAKRMGFSTVLSPSSGRSLGEVVRKGWG